MADFNFRKATIDDLSGIEAIVNKAVPMMNAMGNFQWNQDYPLRPDFEKDIERSVLWVAESKVDGTIAGVAAITFDQYQETAVLGWDLTEKSVVPHRMAVDPDRRKSGIAATFMGIAERIAREEGCKYVRVDTNQHNEPIQNLFIKLGYTYSGEFSFDARPPEQFGMWKGYYKAV